MSTVVQESYENDITYIIDYLVDQKEYTTWKERIREQLVKNVEVPGFRKGKAPEKLMEKYIDTQRLQATIFQETIQKYAPEAAQKAQETLQKDERVVMNVEASIDPEFTAETDDGFKLRVVFALLPQVDTSKINSIKVAKKDITLPENRPTKKDFVSQEQDKFLQTYNIYEDIDTAAKKGNQVTVSMSGTIDGNDEPRLKSDDVVVNLGSGQYLPEFDKGLTGVKKGDEKSFDVNFPADYFEPSLREKKAIFSIVVKSVKAGKYNSLETLFTEDERAGSQFKDAQAFNDFLDKYYEDETARLTEEQRQTTIIRKVVEIVPDFTLDEKRITNETDRIFASLKDDAQKRGVTNQEALQGSGIPIDPKAKLKDDLAIKSVIEEYVRKEFKLSAILNYIYEKLVTNKISLEQHEAAVKGIEQEKHKFGLSDTATKDEINAVATDRLRRQSAANYIFTELVPNPDTAEKPAK